MKAKILDKIKQYLSFKKKCIYFIFMILYILFVLTNVLSIIYGIYIVNNNFSIFILIINIVISVLWILFIIMLEKRTYTITIGIVMLIISLFINNSSFRIFTLINTVIPFFYSLKYDKTGIIQIVTHIVCTILLVCVLLFEAFASSFVSIDITDKYPSQNNKYYIVIRNHDAGATGGSTSATLEKNVMNVLQIRYKILSRNEWGSIYKVKWITNDLVEINNMDYYINGN